MAASEPVYALSGWWRRAAAITIDGLVVAIPGILLGGLVAALFYGSLDAWLMSEEFNIAGELAAQVVMLAVASAYYCILMSRTNGQTVGKLALGIRVVREDGGKITAGYAFKRQILVMQLVFGTLALFLLFIPTLLNYLAPLWDSGNRAWHDQMVGSRVVLAEAPLMAPPSAPAAPYFPQAPHPPFPVAPPGGSGSAPGTSAPPPAPPQPPPPPEGTVPYTPPPGFDNPVPQSDD